MLADNRQNIDAGIILMPEHLDDFALRRRTPFRIDDDADDHLLPRNRAMHMLARDENIPVNALVIRNNEAVRFMIFKMPTICSTARLTTRTTAPSIRVPSVPLLVMRTSTISPCIAVFISLA